MGTMGKTKLLFGCVILALVSGCGKNKTPAPTNNGQPPKEVTAPAPEAPPKVVDDSRLACLHKFETTNPELAHQEFSFEADGKCTYTHSAFPNVTYACTYEVKNHRLAMVKLLVSGTQQGWNFSADFSEDCSEVAPDGFGLKFQRHP